ncbi:MAG: dienelactone [Geobacteraceae bacterium]|nr:MAG: dienelactone [Geobacteraceae bacterium]
MNERGPEPAQFLRDRKGDAMEQPVSIKIDTVTLEGVLGLPEQAKGVVIFAHGSGSSRLSPRNTYVAKVMQEAGIGTLLFDLLTREEDRIYEQRFDIDLLVRRLVRVTRWLAARPELKGAALGYFGASTGAAAALQGAAQLGTAIKAVVSRGGRPDLAMPYLEKVLAPTLLIVGERDVQVLQLNRQAFAHLVGEKELAVVPGATHLFEEPGTLEQAANLAQEWFSRHLG